MVQYSFTSTETRRLVRMDSRFDSHIASELFVVVIDDRFYIALFSALEHSHVIPHD